MDNVEIGNPANLGWLWLVALIAAVLILGAYWMRRSAVQFASKEMLDDILPRKSVLRRALSAACLIGAMLLLVIALIDIRWGQVEREIPQRGIEIMFVLDVSRSMLAEDVSPNRLERAKQMIRDTIDSLSGDRVGLAIFAGEVRQRIPMTNHYEDFKQTLADVGPNDLSLGGSRLGDAISIGAEGFLSQTNDHQAMVILTDGEDMESSPIEAASKAHEETGLRIFTIGLGDLETGARVPVANRGRRGFLEHDGEQVWSKLDGRILTEIAQASDGAYIPAGTKQVDMEDVYHAYISNIEQTDFETAKINRLEARYQWFLAPAVILLILEVFLGAGIPLFGRRATESVESPGKSLTPRPGQKQDDGSNLGSVARSTTGMPASGIPASGVPASGTLASGTLDSRASTGAMPEKSQSSAF